MSSYRLSASAFADLREIHDYISDDNPDAANQLNEKFETKFCKLAEFPNMGSPLRRLGPEVRSATVGMYVIVYRPTEYGIEVVRVLQGNRDIESMFNS